MLLLNIVFILLGFILLIKGGDFLVDGSVAIAQKAKLSPMVIGLTVIGFGTSAPELLVSTQGAIAGHPGIAIGNVVGSNIANIALILGITAIIVPIAIHKTTLRVDSPFMILSVTAMALIGLTGTITRLEGIAFVLLLIGFVSYQIWTARKQAKNEEQEIVKPKMSLWVALITVVLSISALALGAHLLIKGASGLAMKIGMAVGVDHMNMERIIGLTIVAVGTSFPELFAAIQAARKGQTDMAIGNVVGSVTFNILCVVGVASAVCPIEGSNIGFSFDYIMMVFLSILLWVFLLTNRTLERWEGVMLTLIYIGYIAKTIITV